LNLLKPQHDNAKPMDTQLILKSASSPLHSVDAVDSDTTPETAEMMNFTALTVPKATEIEALTTKSGTEP
ncbi:hypothetical protein AVEN_77503-1, partial [Araneus ventricosus]